MSIRNPLYIFFLLQVLPLFLSTCVVSAPHTSSIVWRRYLDDIKSQRWKKQVASSEDSSRTFGDQGFPPVVTVQDKHGNPAQSRGHTGCVHQQERRPWSWSLLQGHSKGKFETLRGGSDFRHLSNKERWESVGFSLQPDLGPEAHTDVPLEVKLGDATEFDDANTVRRLIQAGANVNYVDWAGFTALHRAAFHGNLDALSVLLEAGANPNMQDRIGGRTPLHQAACNGHKRVVEKLLQCGADAHIKDFPYRPQVEQVPGWADALQQLPLPLTPEAGQLPDGSIEYRGMTPKEYAEDEDWYSTAEVLRPWTDEY